MAMFCNAFAKGRRFRRGLVQWRGIVACGSEDTFHYSGRLFHVGAYVTASDFGGKQVPRAFRKYLQSIGLGLCCFTHRICRFGDMATKHESYDGRRRYNLFYHAKKRAGQRNLPLDLDMMRAMAFGPLPVHFNGMAYSMGISQKQLAFRMSLSVDRINPLKGYVRGNVRFLPFWLNMVLNIFSDAKARRIAERMLGIRPLFSTETLPDRLHKHARRKVADKRSTARREGVYVGECFTFVNLMCAGKLITRCPYSGIRLHWEHGPPVGGRYDSVSFDRCLSAGSYTVDNVQVVANSVNALKSNLAISDMQTLVHALDWLETDEFSTGHIPLCARFASGILTT